MTYNKSLQGKCSINIKDYQNTAGCYAIKESNGKYKIKTIENDILIYEGDYLKGKKNGEGKLYKIIDANLNELENKMLYGLILNKYKEFIKSQNANIENKICTEELREGIIKKNGEKYFFFSFLEYEGGFKNGKKNGKGKDYKDNKNLWYEGDFKNGTRDAYGKLYTDKGNLRYEGEFKKGIRDGKGKEYDDFGNLVYEGEFRNNQIWNGKEKGYDNHGNLEFEVEISNKKKSGKGKEYKNGNLVFDGEYLNGNRWNGEIKEYDKNGNLKFEGQYIEGIIYDGKTKELIYDEYNAKDKFLNHIVKGREYDEKGNLIFEGDYKKGVKRWKGKGKEYDINGNMRIF